MGCTLVSRESLLLRDINRLLMLKMLFDKEKVNEEHHVLPRRTQGAWALNLGVLRTRDTDFWVLGSRGTGLETLRPLPARTRLLAGHPISLSLRLRIVKMGTHHSLQVTC